MGAAACCRGAPSCSWRTLLVARPARERTRRCYESGGWRPPILWARDKACGGRDRSWGPSRAASITRKVGRLAPPPTGCPCSERLKRRAKLWLSAGTLLDLIDLPLYKHPVNQPPTSSDQPKPPTTNPNPNHRTPVLTPCPTPYVGGHLPTTTNHQAPNTTNHEHPPHTSPQAQNVNYQLPTTNSHSSRHPFI